MDRAPTLDRRTTLALTGLWATATALNLGKPFHVDDAYYVAQAEWIAAHPDRPMSGLVFWDTVAPAPFHATGNHPPLVPFVYAAVVRLAGPSELGLHAVTALFTALVTVLFHRLARRLAPTHALPLTAAFVLGPAFVAGQNVMLEPALLAAWLAFFVVFADGAQPTAWWRAAAVAAVALLVKLTSVALVAFLLIEALRTRRPRLLGVLALPAAALGAWSAWNLVEHGGAQILDRPPSVLSRSAAGSIGLALALLPARGALWVVVLGGITPGLLALPFVAGRVRPRWLALTALALALLFAGGRLVVACASEGGPEILAREPWMHTLLRGVFFLAGAAGLALAARRARQGDEADRRLASWLGCTALVVVVTAPFVAARHVLLALPPLLLLAARGAPTLRPAAVRAMVAITAAVGVMAAVADHRAASLYAEAPAGLLAPHRARDGVTYFLGHWGFQRYAERAGWMPYVPGRTSLAQADRVVVPRGIHRQPLDPADAARLAVVAEVVVPAGPLDVVRTLVDAEGLYCSWAGLPWSLRTDPRERFVVLALPGP